MRKYSFYRRKLSNAFMKVIDDFGIHFQCYDFFSLEEYSYSMSFITHSPNRFSIVQENYPIWTETQMVEWFGPFIWRKIFWRVLTFREREKNGNCWIQLDTRTGETEFWTAFDWSTFPWIKGLNREAKNRCKLTYSRIQSIFFCIF